MTNNDGCPRTMADIVIGNVSTMARTVNQYSLTAQAGIACRANRAAHRALPHTIKTDKPYQINDPQNTLNIANGAMAMATTGIDMNNQLRALCASVGSAPSQTASPASR